MKRHQEKDLRISSLIEEFEWVESIKRISPITSSKESYVLALKMNVNEYDKKREELEIFIRKFFEVWTGRHQVICCWMTTSLTVIVF